jgi:hypothetical protein
MVQAYKTACMSINAPHSCTGEFVQHSLTFIIAVHFEPVHLQSDLTACLSRDMHVTNMKSYKQLHMSSHIKADQQTSSQIADVQQSVPILDYMNSVYS